MIKRAFTVIYNAIRFIGKKYGKRMLRVAPNTTVEVSKSATLSVGKRFSARRNVELNVRGSAKLLIGDDVFLNSGCILTVREHISIGNGTIFGPGVMLFDNDHKIVDGKILDNEFETAPIKIGNNVWIGAGAIILKGSVIGDNSVIAAGSIVKGEIKENTIMVQKKNLNASSACERRVTLKFITLKFKILIKVFFTKFYVAFPKLISDEAHSKLLYRTMFGCTPDLKHPKTMNEYICATKISDEKLEYWKYTDKYEVRKYVEETVGNQYLNTVVGIYNSFDEIDFDTLPDAFAMKATHGSSYNIIVTDKNKLDKKKARKKFNKWLKKNFYYKDREKNYKNIKPRIMCDAFLRPADGELEEYKLFCFQGKVGFIQHNKQIGNGRFSNIFDANWNLLPVKYGYDGFNGDGKPDNGDELIALAEKLSAKFPFVRVDLYNVDGRIVFSELTFHSGGGLIPFEPKEYDRKFGELLGL